jgi:hypothetical protein
VTRLYLKLALDNTYLIQETTYKSFSPPRIAQANMSASKSESLALPLREKSGIQSPQQHRRREPLRAARKLCKHTNLSLKTRTCRWPMGSSIAMTLSRHSHACGQKSNLRSGDGGYAVSREAAAPPHEVGLDRMLAQEYVCT